MNNYIEVFKRWSDFSGRSTRSEYWYFFLVNAIIQILLFIVLFLSNRNITIIVFYAYELILIIPGLAVSVRRLHDVGKSGAMLLIDIIPLIGPIWLLVLMVKDSDSGDNKYGPNPKISFLPTQPVAPQA